jgi:two-component system nitrogen regulation response regulator NtrX
VYVFVQTSDPSFVFDSAMARHILVVDDDGDVRNVIIDMLVDNGFVATAAQGGVAMREVVASDGIPVDAVILDARMRGEASGALALHAKGLQIPVVMISGSRDAMKFADDHGLQLLRKPFHVAELMRAVEDAIASGQFGQRDA